MQPYLQTTTNTTAASSLLALLHHFNKAELTKENEFLIWRKTVNLPTRASSIYGLSVFAHQQGLNPKIIVEKKEYDFPDYRFQRYKKQDIQQAAFSSKLHLQKAQELNIPIQEFSFTLTDVKKELQKPSLLLLRLNAGLIRQEKSTSQYLLLYGYNPQHQQFQVMDPVQGNILVSEDTMKEAFHTLETKKYRDHRMIVFEK